MNAWELIRSRRSTRKYEPKVVERGKLEQIVEAGRYAPSGGNCQTTHFIVIRSREVLDQLAGLVKQEFAEMEVREGMYASLVHSIEASRKGAYIFHYNAPALIVTANQKDYGNNIAHIIRKSELNDYRRGALMESILIKDTTREEREQIIAKALAICGGSCDFCNGCDNLGGGRIDEIYRAYIEGEKEIAEINAEYRTGFVRA